MNRKSVTFMVLSSLIIGGLGGWIFTRYIIPKISTIPFLVRYNLAPQGSPLVINRREEIRVNEGSDSIAAIQKAQPWLVSVLSGADFSRAQVQGSGVILTSDGIIAIPRSLFSNKSQTFKLGMYDGRILNAAPLSEDPASDLVLIKADGNNLPTANLGYAKDLQLGQRMIVLYPTLNEFHFTNQISFLSTDLRSFSDKVYNSDKFAQTFKIDDLSGIPDGAAALSLDGNVQGIYEKNAVITADDMRDFLNRYFKENTPSIQRAVFGFNYEPISKTAAAAFSLPEGLLVKKVSAAGPAQAAGLKEGDVITKINGSAANLDNSWEDFVRQNPAAVQVQLEVSRAGQTLQLNLKSGTAVLSDLK